MPEARKSVQSMADYRSPIIARTALNLDLNENASGCSPRVLAKLRSLTSGDVSQYPQREVGERVVADFLGLDPRSTLLTNGIDDALHLLFAAYLDEQSDLVLAEPTFSMYRIYGQATGATVHSAPYADQFSFPTEHLLASINKRTRLIVIANPNNPTGTVAHRDDLVRIIEKGADAAVVIDEAYFEFYGQSLLSELPRFANLFITRTFSKAYGLAGLRLGVVAGAHEQIDLLKRLSSPFNINSVALSCLPEALADSEFVQDYVEQVRAGREQLYMLCDELKLRYWRSQANFVLVEIGPQSGAFVAEMLRRGIAVSDRSTDIGCRGCVRIAIATKHQMSEVIESVRAAFYTASNGEPPQLP